MEDQWDLQLELAKQKGLMLKEEMIRYRTQNEARRKQRIKKKDLPRHNSLSIRFARFLIRLGEAIESKEVKKQGKRVLA